MKYIFVAGVPGSKWSSVVKNIYYSTDIDRSDYSDARTYYHDATGEMQLMHLGAYFDPGMEFGSFFDSINQATKTQCEYEFNQPFTADLKQNKSRIIKSHVFCNHIDFLKATWPENPIVLVYRDNDSSLGWWVKCGHFNITYPKYDEYYRDLRTMSKIIEQQNRNLLAAWQKYSGSEIKNSVQLCDALDIRRTNLDYFQDYEKSNIQVKVI